MCRSASNRRWRLGKPVDLALSLRHPRWSRTAEVRINGEVVARSAAPGHHVGVKRTWQDGDRVELVLAMVVVLELE